MFNVADIIVIALIIFSIFSGYKKGFIRTGFGIVSFFVAIFITFMFYKPVMGFIREKTDFETWISSYLYNINISAETEEVEDTSESGDAYISKLPEIVVDIIGIEEIKENAKVVIIEKIVDFVLKLLSIIIVYILAKLILSVAVMILDSIAKLPVLKQFNELLGLVLGGMLGIIQVYTICAIITLISSIPGNIEIATVINNSLFAHLFYNNNVLLKILF